MGLYFFSSKIKQEVYKKWRDKLNYLELKNNCLVKSDIGKDWFIAYIDGSDLKYIKNYNSYRIKKNNSGTDLKVRIYYKDLKSVYYTYKFSIIRKIGEYKIIGKKR